MEKWQYCLEESYKFDYPIQKKLSLIVVQELKLFLTLELNDSFRMLRLFPRTLYAGPDISKFFLRFSGFIPVYTLPITRDSGIGYLFSIGSKKYHLTIISHLFLNLDLINYRSQLRNFLTKLIEKTNETQKSKSESGSNNLWLFF